METMQSIARSLYPFWLLFSKYFSKRRWRFASNRKAISLFDLAVYLFIRCNTYGTGRGTQSANNKEKDLFLGSRYNMSTVVEIG